jgi:hypothetical protein
MHFQKYLIEKMKNKKGKRCEIWREVKSQVCLLRESFKAPLKNAENGSFCSPESFNDISILKC